MLKRSLICLPVLFMLLAATGGAQDQPVADPDLDNQVQDLKKENEELRGKVNRLEDKVDEVLEKTSAPGGALDRNYSMYEEEIISGFIRKGSETGTMDKLLNINLFMAARYQAVQDWAGASMPIGPSTEGNVGTTASDVDRFSIPFTRLQLSGQAFRTLHYEASVELSQFNNNWLYNYPFYMDTSARLYDAVIHWRPDVEETALLENFDLGTGLTRTFLSPSGEEQPWQLDFIEYPSIVYSFLPPGLARDTGIYARGDFLDQGRLKIWLGFWNGAHRTISMDPGYRPINSVDAWGGGDDSDNLTTMARIQGNILDEHDYYLMVSGGGSWGSVQYSQMTAAGVLQEYGSRLDTIYNLASEFRFLERKAWVKGEFMHSYLQNSLAPTNRGYYVSLGTSLDFIDEVMSTWEVLYRYDRIRLSENLNNGTRSINNTLGINYYFDPEHKHDAKLQFNYVWRDDNSGLRIGNAFQAQFVIGF